MQAREVREARVAARVPEKGMVGVSAIENEMTPVQRLCQILDELGVEHEHIGRFSEGGKVTWRKGDVTFHASNAWPRNDFSGTRLVVHAMYPTPEQAVELTHGLGGGIDG